MSTPSVGVNANGLPVRAHKATAPGQTLWQYLVRDFAALGGHEPHVQATIPDDHPAWSMPHKYVDVALAGIHDWAAINHPVLHDALVEAVGYDHPCFCDEKEAAS